MSKSKVFKFLVTFATLGLFSSCGNTYFYDVNIVDNPIGVSISNNKMEANKDFSAIISLDSLVVSDKILPETLDYVKVGNNTVLDYTYEVEDDYLSAYFTLPLAQTIGNVDIKLTLTEKTKPIIITLDAKQGTFSNGNDNLKLTYTNEKSLSDFADYEEPVANDEEYEFTNWLDGETVITNSTKLNFTTSVTLTAEYKIKHIHEYNDEIIDSQLYKVCSSCGKSVRYDDDTLKTDFKDKIFIKENEKFILYSKDQINSVISKHENNELFLLYGEYNLQGSSTSPVNVNIHGLIDSKNEMLSTIICYNWGEDFGYWPVEIHGLNLTIDNVIMKGLMSYFEGGFYIGIYSDSMICNNCKFIGKQSLYAEYAEINNSLFDSSVIVDRNKSDYAIYVYNASLAKIKNSIFNTNGKAIKVYNEGGVASHLIVESCTFNTVNNPIEDKAAIEIDGTYHSTDQYVVEIKQCTFNGGFTNKHYNDTAGNSEISEDC